jgi:hypothetical protein
MRDGGGRDKEYSGHLKWFWREDGNIINEKLTSLSSHHHHHLSHLHSNLGT